MQRLLRIAGIPDAAEVVIGPTCQVSPIGRPSQSTHFQLVAMGLIHAVLWLAYVMVMDGAVTTATVEGNKCSILCIYTDQWLDGTAISFKFLTPEKT